MTEQVISTSTEHRWYSRPVLFVTDLNRALHFYGQLGFEKNWHSEGGAGTVCQVSRSDCEIILCQDAARRDKARLFIELTAEGLRDFRRELSERSVPNKATGGVTTVPRSTIRTVTSCCFRYQTDRDGHQSSPVSLYCGADCRCRGTGRRPVNRERDPYDLDRFVEAQAQNYDEALAELRAGQKRSHWSWYVLPQIQGLGSSPMSVRYAISGIAEARAYVNHPLLGARLRETVAAINAHHGVSAADILGAVDAQKFHSCMTLFAQVCPEGSLFHEALVRHFSGASDRNTMNILARQAQGGPPLHR